MTTIVLILLVHLQSTPTAPTPLKLIEEQAPTYSIENGVIELLGSPGWIATERSYADFDLTFEFQAKPDADLGVGLRALEWAQRGCRLNLTANVTDVPALFACREETVDVLHRGLVKMRPQGEWQKWRLPEWAATFE